eukprot:410305_1
MAYVIMFVSLIVAVFSQRFCMSLLGDFSDFNGQFVYRGGRNDGKNYYEIDNTDQAGCSNPGYLYWNSNPMHNWFIGSSYDAPILWNYMCTDIIDENDPSTCTNWDDTNSNSVGIILTADDCPYDAMCDTITLSPKAGNCSGTFNYIAPNRFGNVNGWYLIYQEKWEKWVCWSNIVNVVGCPFAMLGIPNTWKQTNFGMKRPFQDGDVQTYDGIAAIATTPSSVQFTCNGHNTVDPSQAPSPSPTIPSNPPTKKPSYNPTFNPSKAPSDNPTLDPSKAPSNDPTKGPSKSPSIGTLNPTQIPTSTPSMMTLNPSINPSINPTMRPTENPTIAPTTSTGSPSRNPSQAPSIPYVEPTEASDVPSNAPTRSSIEPTKSTGNPTPIETIGDVHEDPVAFFQYYWENNRFYVVAGGTVLVIVFVVCCFCVCKPSATRRERYRYRGNGRSRAFQSRTRGSAPVQSVSYRRSQTGSEYHP